MAGVVLERHLAQVADDHTLQSRKKNSTISSWNDLLKENGVIEVPQWRRIQLLGDPRNLCDHDKQKEPTRTDAAELVDGVKRVIKTVF